MTCICGRAKAEVCWCPERREENSIIFTNGHQSKETIVSMGSEDLSPNLDCDLCAFEQFLSISVLICEM